jgi:hypothetical protein
MKFFISLLLQFPLFAVLCLGLGVITGLSNWWYIPIAVILLVSYDIGSEMSRRV